MQPGDSTLFDAERGLRRVRAAPAELRRRGRRARSNDAERRGALRPRGQRERDRRRRARGARAGHRRLRRARDRRGSVDDGRRPRAPLRARREPLPANGDDARGRRLADEQRGRATAGRAVPAARDTRARLRVGDAVRRLHPGRARARPLPPLRRGRLRARGRGRAAHRRRDGAAARGLVRPPARAARPLPREHRARRDAACSASSGPAGSPAEAYYPDGTAAASR